MSWILTVLYKEFSSIKQWRKMWNGTFRVLQCPPRNISTDLFVIACLKFLQTILLDCCTSRSLGNIQDFWPWTSHSLEIKFKDIKLNFVLAIRHKSVYTVHIPGRERGMKLSKPTASVGSTKLGVKCGPSCQHQIVGESSTDRLIRRFCGSILW